MSQLTFPLYSLLLQLTHNVRLKALRLGDAAPALHDLAVAADEEFLEIPLHALQAEKAGLLALPVFRVSRGTDAEWREGG